MQQLSLIYFTFVLFVLLSTAVETEPDIQCSTSRRLLFFGSLPFPLGEKKPTSHVSSSSKSSSSSSSPPKLTRIGANAHGLTIYVRPQTSTELGHKVRSYSHLLKSKLYTKAERAQLKQKSQDDKKKTTKKSTPKKNTTQSHISPISTPKVKMGRELVAIDDGERERCRAILHLDSPTTTTTTIATTNVKDEKKKKKKKNEIKQKAATVKRAVSSKVKNATARVASVTKKKLAPSPVINKHKQKTEKSNKNSHSATEEKKKSKEPPPVVNHPSETRPVTPSVKVQTPPPSSSPSIPNIKPKRETPEKTRIIEDITELFPDNETNDNNSVVGRAYHFVKHMFQLSDDLLEENPIGEEDPMIDSSTEQSHHHPQSRKLLAIDNDIDDYELDLYSNDNPEFDDMSFASASVFKRELLSFKPSKHTTREKRSKSSSTNPEAKKPKVGWAYRYRISRYNAAQKNRGKSGGGGRINKQQQQQSHSKKTNNIKLQKRKLLAYNDDSTLDDDQISDQEDIVNSVSIIQQFIPKRQLLSINNEEENDNDDDDDKNERRRLKEYHELTDPQAIVRSYDKGLFKPRVGWQFRYRVSRYIDSLRENIREDQERLKKGLQAIKRKTPQELSGRRKRVLDKPFAPDPEEVKQVEEAKASLENKPNVGWRYRYRVSKMLEAKQRGDYVDDEEEKRKARIEGKKKQQQPGIVKPVNDNDECIEWEHDLDPELRKLSDEDRRVGWAYRYRVRRKLDDLKKQHADLGIPFDVESLGGKRDKKVSAPLTPAGKKAAELEQKQQQQLLDQQAEDKKKAVGWQYRYRVSKMREAQKREPSKTTTSSASTKKHATVPLHEGLDPELARLTPEERVVGWKYRYRIRRKLDSLKNASRTVDRGEGGKRAKKRRSAAETTTAQRTPGKRKHKEKLIKQVEESIEKILNIDDIEETPFMEYFRRGSVYVLSGLVPTARKSICLLPLPVTLPFCKEDKVEDNDNKKSKQQPTIHSEQLKSKPVKKLRTKKEHRAKQFIRTRATKFGVADKDTERRVDETIRVIYTSSPPSPPATAPTPTSETSPKKQYHHRIRPPTRRIDNEQTKHFDEEEEPIRKMVGIETKKKKNKKRYQIIGKEVKIKHKHPPTHPPSPVTTTASNPPPPPPPPVLTSPPPIDVENPPSSPPPPKVKVEVTPPPPVLVDVKSPPSTPRTIAEVIKEEAATLLSPKSSSARTPDEVKEETNEANEDFQENVKLKAAAATSTPSSPNLVDSTTSGEEDNDSTTNDSESDSNEETEEEEKIDRDKTTSTHGNDAQSRGGFFQSPLKKMNQLFENAKESIHEVFDLQNEKDSS